MTSNENLVMEILNNSNAFLSGHFKLSSGLHSGNYLQCAQVFKYPDYSETISRLLVNKIKAKGIEFDTVISPAIGGILFGYEVARQSNNLNIFAERDSKNIMSLRRGFEISEGEKFLVVEDVITTGGSVKEIIELVLKKGGLVTAVGCVADRSKEHASFNAPLFSLVKLDFPIFEPDKCPLCIKKLPIIKPGSKK